MYLQNDGFSGYDNSGNQIRRRGLFLILIQPKNSETKTLKAIVRTVALRQFGHFMMGSAKIGNTWYIISGSYGNDGLPLTVPDTIYNQFGLDLPSDLYNAWNNGAGWNSAGSEAPSMRQWALENLSALIPQKRKVKL